MTHSKIRASLNEYVDRTLPGKQRSEVSAHLASCESCADEVRELEATVSLLRRMPEVEPPPAFAQVVMARVRDGEAEPRSLRRSLRQLFQPTITVTATAAVAGLAVFAATRDLATLPIDVPQVAQLPTEAAPSAPVVARVAPPAPERVAPAPPVPRAPAQLASNTPNRGMDRALRNQMLRRSRALLRHGHSDEVARTLRGAGHPYSATLAGYFEDRSDNDSIHLTVASRELARRR